MRKISKNRNSEAKLPLDILKKLATSTLQDSKEIEVVTISGENVDKVKATVNNLGGTYEELGYGFGIANIGIDKIESLINTEVFQYIELPKSLYTSDNSSNEAACINSAKRLLNLSGKGVLVGFIDSGIDYENNAFRNVDGTTRIEYIYDLSQGKKVYDKQTINEALKSSNPFSIVPHSDQTEHGTHVAGIACAGGNIPKSVYGVAPESSIAMVKTVRGLYSLSTNILRGLKFLIDKSKELKMPLVVNISLSTNDGAHNGTSLLEQYIFTACNLERITVVIAAGNEGEASHHVGGLLSDEETVNINIASDEKSVTLNLFKPVLPYISIEVVNSSGRSTGEVNIQEGIIEKEISGDKITFFIKGASPFDLIGEVLISIVSRNQFILPGQWKIIIRVKNSYYGVYDIWLPISEGLNTKTKFVKPNIYNTLGIPATVRNVISVGSYNYINNTISAFSGRGKKDVGGDAKPDLVAPGEGIQSVVPGGGFDKKSGTSMATPHVAGVAALMMEWGIVNKNDPYLYGERLKYFLIKGAKRGDEIIYPNPIWGYGRLCALDAFNVIINLEEARSNDENYYEYNVGNMLVRIPNY